MTIKRVAARAISEVFSLNPSARQTGLRILLYHSVGSRISDNLYGISVTTRSFQRQMRMLSTMEDVPIVKLDASPPPASGFRVAITFDDGYKDNLNVVAPILTELNIPFTVFVTAAFITSTSTDYLTARELRELAEQRGAAIGSHGFTHCRLAECDDRALWHELNESRQFLQDMIGKPVTAISYPHGSVSLRVRDAAHRAGYTVGATSQFGINRANQDPLLLRRCEIVSRDTERVFMQKLRGHWDWKARWQSWPQASDF